MKLRHARRVAIGLGGLSCVAIVLAVLALQDIFHGEPDLQLEWAILRIAFIVIITFHVSALAALMVRKDTRQAD